MDSTLQGTPQHNMVSPAATTQQQQHGQVVGTPFGLPPPPAVAPAAGLMEALLEHGVSVEPADMLRELAVQHTNIWKVAAGDAREQAVNGLADKIIGSSNLVTLIAVMDGFVRVVHSVHKYYGQMFHPSTFDDKIIGFVGDRADGVDPSAVILSREHFRWVELDAVTSELELATFYSAPENKKKLFSPGTAVAKVKVNLPRLLLIPGGLIPWLLAGPRTPMELHARLNEVMAPDADARPPELELSLLWCRVVSQASPTLNAVSALATFAAPACPDSPAIRKWLKDRIGTTLGKEPASSQQQHVVYQQLPPYPTPYEQSPGQPTSRGDTAPKGMLSDTKKAFLCGLSGVMECSELDPVWFDIQAAVEVDEVRTAVMTTMDTHRLALGVENADLTNYWFEDQWLKDLKKCSFAVGGVLCVWEWLMRGICILNFMDFSPQQKASSIMSARTWDLTEASRNEDQVNKRLKSEPRTPPGNWHALKDLFTTYGIFLRALFGEKCPHFIQVWKIRTVIASMRHQEKEFDRDLCHLIVWHVVRDAQQFFSTEVAYAALKTLAREQIEWPISHLQGVSNNLHSLSHQALITKDFPSQWGTPISRRQLEFGRNQQQGGGRNGGGFGGGGNGNGSGGSGNGNGFGGGGNGNGSRGGGNGNGGGGNGNGGGGYGNGGGRYGNGGRGGNNTGANGQYGPATRGSPRLNDALGGLLAEVRRMGATFGAIMAAGNVYVTSLPTVPGCISPQGRNTVCYAHLLGLCSGGDRCSFDHPDGDRSHEFVERLVAIVKPALEAYLERRQHHDRRGTGRYGQQNGGGGTGRGNRGGGGGRGWRP